MNKQQMEYIVDCVLEWEHPRSTATKQHFMYGASFNYLQKTHSPFWKFNVRRDVEKVKSLYAQAHNIINAKLL